MTGWACTKARDLCVERKLHAKSGMWPSAVKACAANGARVCTRADLLASCGINGFSPFATSAGWFGDRVPAPSSRVSQPYRWFHAWNDKDYCSTHGHTTAGAQLLPSDRELPFRCCRAAPLGGRKPTALAPASACPAGWYAGKSSTCMTLKPYPAVTYAHAAQSCRSKQARVCTIADVLTACGSNEGQGKASPFYGMPEGCVYLHLTARGSLCASSR